MNQPTTVQPPEAPARRRASGPKFASLPASAHLLEPVLDWARRDPTRPVAASRRGDGLVWITAAEFAADVRALARGLIASGVQAGDRVALMSTTRVEWALTDYAILAAGAVTVPIYETCSQEQVDWILADSGAVLAVAETSSLADRCRAAAGSAPAGRETLVIDEGGLDELRRRGGPVADAAIDERLGALGTETLATVVYTSGTTGRPKGCMLTHGNLRANVAQTLEAARGMLGTDETTLLFLPLAHTLARAIWLFSYEHGIHTVFATDLASVPEELILAQPTLVVAVPYVFEKAFHRALHRARTEGHGAIFERAVDVASLWSRGGGRARPVLRAQHVLFDRLVYGKVRAAFGGRLRFAVSGGGPLGERLTYFFAGAGIDIYEGYGMTETSPVLTLNLLDAWRPGTVGRPVPGTEVELLDDGEIRVRGPQVFGGYWHNPAATAEVLDDQGWLSTGDVGALDDAGFVRITGRKKELIVTSGGKNVAPVPLEDRLRADPLIGEAVVVGDARPYVVALLALDEDGLADWASERGREVTDVAAAAQDPEVLAALQEAVDAANASVSRAESIRRFALLPRRLSIEAGELTPTLKIRRGQVEQEFAELVAGLYRS